MKLPLYLRILLLLTLIGCGWLFWQDTPDSHASAPTAVIANPPRTYTSHNTRASTWRSH